MGARGSPPRSLKLLGLILIRVPFEENQLIPFRRDPKRSTNGHYANIAGISSASLPCRPLGRLTAPQWHMGGGADPSNPRLANSN